MKTHLVAQLRQSLAHPWLHLAMLQSQIQVVKQSGVVMGD
jgi:hypothetical protein